MEGIIVGTLILWVLAAVVVAPLTSLCVSYRMRRKGVQAESLDDLPEEKKQYWKRIATMYYMFWDVVVLGCVGFIAGLVGYFFIGISLEAKGWPGMLAFIGASFFGLSLGPAGTY